MSEELKVCPFCGGEAEWQNVGASRDRFCVKCLFCWAKSIYVYEWEKEDAINNWNTRHGEKEKDERIKELEDEIYEKSKWVCGIEDMETLKAENKALKERASSNNVYQIITDILCKHKIKYVCPPSERRPLAEAISKHIKEER